MRPDFDQNPFIAIWETTRACDLACLHCRAEAINWRHPLELNTEESLRLIDQVCACGNPLFVLTGGDPMKRRDLFDIIPYAVSKKLRVAMTPSGTPLMTLSVVEQLKDAGLARSGLRHDRELSG